MPRRPGLSDAETMNTDEEIPDIMGPGDGHGISAPSRNDDTLALVVSVDLIAEVPVVIGSHGVFMLLEFLGIRGPQGE